MKKRVVIMGAGGRDFQNFLQYFKDNPQYEVVAFTAAQIPGIEKRTFPKSMAGRLYKRDIPIYSEERLVELIKKEKIDEVCLAYSDLSHQEVMEKASMAMAAGASFRLLGPKDTMIRSKKPVIAICAVRTGAGKSQTSRAIAKMLKDEGYNVVAVRHPMPYGDLKKMVVQRFAKVSDMKKQRCTIEEEEEYTPWIEMGIPVYAGVDYKKILERAEKEAEVIIWDGGNNDFSFFKPTINVVVLDPHRSGHEITYYPGMVNFLSADVLIINKVDTASASAIKDVEMHCKVWNPKATIIRAASPQEVKNPEWIKGKKVIVIEDGPTVTHGGMSFGAGTLVAKKYGGKIIDAEKFAVGSIKEIYKKYLHVKKILPAMGYSRRQMKELEQTINRSDADAVVDGSPVNLSNVIKTKKRVVNVSYSFKELGKQKLKKMILSALKK